MGIISGVEWLGEFWFLIRRKVDLDFLLIELCQKYVNEEMIYSSHDNEYQWGKNVRISF